VYGQALGVSIEAGGVRLGSSADICSAPANVR